MKNNNNAGDVAARLRTSERINQMLLNATSDVVFLLDRDKRIMAANDAFAAFTGLPVEEIRGRFLFELQPRESTEWRRAQLERVVATGRPVHGEDELDGVAYEHDFYPVLDDRGAVVQLAVFARDISARKHLEQAREEQLRLLARVNKELRQRNREILLLNQMMELLLLCRSGAEAWQVITEAADELFNGDPGALFTWNSDRSGLEAAVVWGAEPPRERSFRNEDCWAQRRGRLHLVPDMQTGLLCRHTRARATPHGSLCLPLLVHGESLGIFQLLPRRREGTENWENRLEERRQLAVNAANSISLALINLQFRERMTDLTVRDHFTGLFNRRSLEGTLPREMSRCENRGRPLGIIMFAIDNFARFNQAYGYEVGDAVLRELGALLERNIRTHGRAYRYSGAKFVLVLPEVAAAAALGQAEFFRQEIKKLLSHNGRDFPPPFTMSGGVVVFPDHGATANDLLKGAELALARAKQEGPDRLFLAPAGGRTA